MRIELLPSTVGHIALHLKPCFYAEITRELNTIDFTNLEIGVPGRVYDF